MQGIDFFAFDIGFFFFFWGKIKFTIEPTDAIRALALGNAAKYCADA